MEELTKIFTPDAIAVMLGVATFILAILALWQRHRYHRLQESVYQEQGIFKKPNIIINLYNSKNVFKYIYALPLDDGIWEVPLRIHILNNGEKDSEELEIQYKINKLISYSAQKEATLEGPQIKNAKVFQYDEGGPFVSTVVTLDNLRHHQATSFDVELIFRSGTITLRDIKVQLEDGVDAIAMTWINYSFPMDVFVSQKEFEPVSNRFQIQFVDTTECSIEEFFGKYNSDIKDSIPPPKGFLDRLRRMREQSGKIENIILVTPDLKSKETEVVKLPDKEVTIHRLPITAIKFQEGVYLGKSQGYFIPNVTHRV